MQGDTNWLIRFLLLMFAFAVLFGSASLLKTFEYILREHVELAFFLPLIVGHAGNCGSQTVATTVRAIGCGADMQNRRRRILQETLLGTWSTMILGALLALLNCAAGLSSELNFVVFTSFLTMGILASFVAVLICFVVQTFKIDPAQVAGPFVTTFVDIAGVSVYYGLAHAVIHTA